MPRQEEDGRTLADEVIINSRLKRQETEEGIAMRYTINAGMMLAAMFMFGPIPGIAMESNPGEISRAVQKQEEIHAVDETWHFEVSPEAMPVPTPSTGLEKVSVDSNGFPPPALGQDREKIVEADHDFFLHP